MGLSSFSSKRSLNLLRSSRINPKLAVQSYLFDQFNLNKITLAPPGIKFLVFDNLDKRTSWAHNSKVGYIIGPAMDH